MTCYDLLPVFQAFFLIIPSNNTSIVSELLRKDYEEVGIETAEGAGEEAGYGDEL